jgi:hypothetical protein
MQCKTFLIARTIEGFSRAMPKNGLTLEDFDNYFEQHAYFEVINY